MTARGGRRAVYHKCGRHGVLVAVSIARWVAWMERRRNPGEDVVGRTGLKPRRMRNPAFHSAPCGLRLLDRLGRSGVGASDRRARSGIEARKEVAMKERKPVAVVAGAGPGMVQRWPGASRMVDMRSHCWRGTS
jgi:hypothetical protein